VFAGMNMGVIALGALVGLWLFKEKLSKWNWVGIGLAMMAVAILAYTK
jgi:multidrug transporter EmrE-like cation transporter